MSLTILIFEVDFLKANSLSPKYKITKPLKNELNYFNSNKSCPMNYFVIK